MPETKAGLLIADDDPFTRILLSKLFAEQGYCVRSVADGSSALAEIRRQLPEFFIFSLNMPGTSSFELLVITRNEFPEIRVIAMSNAPSGDDIPYGVAVDRFFHKHSGFGVLLKVVRSLPRHEGMAQQTHPAPPPVWVSKYQQKSAGVGYVTIECPECRGSFQKVLKGVTTPTGETDCLHCGGSIRYSVVQPDDQPSFQTFLLPLQRRHSAPSTILQSMETLAS